MMNAVLNADTVINQISITDQLKVSVFGHLKNQVLEDIITSYDARAAKLTEDLAIDIAIEIGTNHPDVAKVIESSYKSDDKEKVISNILKAKPVVEKIDEYFKGSNLNKNEVCRRSLYLCNIKCVSPILLRSRGSLRSTGQRYRRTRRS